MNYLEKTIMGAARAMFGAGGLLLTAMLGLTLTNIVLRSLFGQSLRGVVEISGYMCAGAIGLCLPLAQARGCHVAAGMLEERLPLVWIRCQRGLTAAACVLFLGMAALEMASLGLFVLEMDERVDGWNISYYGMVFALAAGCAMQAMVVLMELARGLRGPGVARKTREENPEERAA